MLSHLEGNQTPKRPASQEIRTLRLHGLNGLNVNLLPLDEFSRWVARHLDCAQVMVPPELVEKFRQGVAKLGERYSNPE